MMDVDMRNHHDEYFIWYWTINGRRVGPLSNEDETINELENVIEKIEEKEMDEKGSSFVKFLQQYKPEVAPD